MMPLALALSMVVISAWCLIEFVIMVGTSIKGELVPEDTKLVVYFLLKNIVIIAACVMSAIYIARAGGIV